MGLQRVGHNLVTEQQQCVTWWYVTKKLDCQAATLKHVSLYSATGLQRYVSLAIISRCPLASNPQNWGSRWAYVLPSGRYPQATVRQWEGAEILCTSLPAPRAHLHPQGLTGGPVPWVKAPGPAKRPPRQRAWCRTRGSTSDHHLCAASGGYQPRTILQIATLPWDPGMQAWLPIKAIKEWPLDSSCKDSEPDAYKSSTGGIPASGGGGQRAKTVATIPLTSPLRVPAGPQMPVRSDTCPQANSKTSTSASLKKSKHPESALHPEISGWCVPGQKPFKSPPPYSLVGLVERALLVFRARCLGSPSLRRRS